MKAEAGSPTDTTGKVFCLGAATIDLVTEVGQFPLPDTKVEADCLTIHPGGPAFTGAAFLAWKGWEVHFSGVCGTDLWGQYLRNEMVSRNVRYHPPVGGEADGTNVALVWVETESARRTILWKNTGVMEKPRHLSPEARKMLSGASLLYLDGHGGELVIEAVNIAKAHGIPILFDGGSRKDTDDKVLPAVDDLIVSSRFAEQYFPGLDPRQAMEEMEKRWGPFRRTGITLGEEGSWACLADGAVRHFPAFPVEAIDTNGAGDIFHATFAWRLLEGDDDQQSWLQATQLAAESTTAHGGGISWIDQQTTRS
ncbi:MAG: PfkB family carbohydrate kinase [Opitutales bacterium]|nr:PfkB family carbohydrate kinase [Opitutales bacterium]